MSGAVVQRARELRGRVQEYIDGAVAAQWRMGSVINNVRPVHRASAINLVHYVWLRGHDIRGLQAELADLGLSSLGRLESRVLPTSRSGWATMTCPTAPNSFAATPDDCSAPSRTTGSRASW